MAIYVANNGQLQTVKGIYYGMSEDLREIKSLYIKNRLTEGVDFKRYEWLKGNGTAYINTMIPPTSNDVLRAVGIIVSKPTYINIGFISSSDEVYFRYIGSGGSYYKNENTQFIIQNKEISQPESYIAPRLDGIHYAMNNTDFDFSVTFKVNKVPTYTISSTKGLFTQSALRPDLMATNFPTSTYLIGKSYSFVGLDTCKLSDVYINSHHFVPCQLLKSIPATLDANNIARSAGECGMYDSVSGKFYGNVANSGTFTVEGEVEPETHTGLQQIYQNKLIEGVDYETADWLKGDGSAYIDTGIKIPKEVVNVKCKFVILNQPTSKEYTYILLSSRHTTWGGSVGEERYPIVSLNPRTDVMQIYNDFGRRRSYIAFTFGQEKTINFTTDGDNQTEGTLQVFYNDQLKWDYYTVLCAKIAFIELLCNSLSLNLVPCTLLRSIPRNLDAQCKERAAGECGMIDLISGKFYGNVASSGTFTVENDNE